MPIRERSKVGGCWANRSLLERILIGVLSAAIIISILLLIFVIKKFSPLKPSLDNNTCSTITCLNEAAKLAQQIDPTVNPCEDFYQFACGNFLKNAHGDEKLNLFVQMWEQRKQELMDIYAEEIKDEEHKMVKVAKKLFQACMNETEIERDNLGTLKDVITKVGGWPLLEGFKWDKENFNWLRTIYKLREFGYDFAIFLNLKVQRDIANTGRYIFTVEASSHGESILSKYPKTQAVDIMTEIAVLLGANKASAAKDMDATYRFWNYLRLHTSIGNKYRLTVSEYQQRFGDTFDWLGFINNITGATVSIAENDYVLFDEEESMRKYIELIKTTPKRTLGNYMMWTVVEKQLPYLTAKIRNLVAQEKKPYDNTRASFCLKEAEARFIPSPIEIMYNRNYLSAEKKQKVGKILQNVKSEFIQALKKAKWLKEKDKTMTVVISEAITLQIGLPGNYFDDKMLNDLNTDMVETKTNTFLSLLAQVNKNHQTNLYKQINMSISENKFDRRYFKDDFSTYDEEDNLIFVPTIATQGFIFHESRPNYLNYRFMGNLFSGMLSFFEHDFNINGKTTEKWSNETKESASKTRECLMKEMTDCKLNENKFEVIFAAYQGMGEEISYAAYEKWAKINGQEQKLIGIDYTPRQLFWIQAILCQVTNIYPTFEIFSSQGPNFYKNVACAVRRNNHNFAKDFNCPVGSKMNPAVKCEFW